MSSPEGSRFSEYTPNDHQAPLWIATSITLTYGLLFLIVRLAVKFKVLGLDDLVLAAANVAGVAQWGIMFQALADGVGKRVPGIEQTSTSKLVFVSRILTLLTLGLTKGSVLLFLRQIFAGTSHKGQKVCSALLIGTGLWTVASVMAVSIDCSPSGALLLQSESRCTGDLTRWRVVTGLDVCLELILVIIPTCLFYSVQISRSRKLTIFGAFIPRIVVPALFIAHLQAYVKFRRHSGTSLDAVNSLVWQQILCGYSLMSATTPCLKGFLGRFRTEDLARLTDGHSGTRTYTQNSQSQNSRSRRNPVTYVMQSLDGSNSKRRLPKDQPVLLANQSPAQSHSATAYADFADNGDGSVKSFGSERMMIHHKVEYDVTSS